MSNKIRDAIEVIAEKGWIKGVQERPAPLGDGIGPMRRAGVCIMGAGDYAEWRADELRRVTRVIEEQYPGEPMNIPMFNDDPKTKIEDVLMVLEKAAIRLDEEV